MNSIDDKLPGFETIGLKTDQKPLKEKSLGQEDFMELMLAQMNHQDPFKPMENGEFLTQMAQFSAVSGLKDIKDSFKSLSESMQSNQALQAASMVGRQVLVKGANADLLKGMDLKGTIDLTAATDELIVNVKDKSGQVVKQINLGSQAPGKIDFKWDGKIDSKPADKSSLSEPGLANPAATETQAVPGSYEFDAYITVDGEKQAVNTLVFDKVDSVSVGNATQPMMLNLATGNKVKLSEVYKIM